MFIWLFITARKNLWDSIDAEGINGVPQDKEEAMKWFREAAGRYPRLYFQKRAAERLKELEAETRP